MVSHCNFHWIWWDLDQNPSESRKFSKNQPISAARGSWEASLAIFKRYVSRGVHFWGLCCDLKTFGARKPKKNMIFMIFYKSLKNRLSFYYDPHCSSPHYRGKHSRSMKYTNGWMSMWLNLSSQLRALLPISWGFPLFQSISFVSPSNNYSTWNEYNT